MIATLVAVLGGCSERTPGEACYEPNPDPFAQLGTFTLICGQPWGTKPETPDGLDEDRGPYTVFYSEPREPGTECPRCPAYEIDERIREHLFEIMSNTDMSHAHCLPPEVDHIEPGCYRQTDDDCLYTAWYWGSCNIKG